MLRRLLFRLGDLIFISVFVGCLLIGSRVLLIRPEQVHALPRNRVHLRRRRL